MLSASRSLPLGIAVLLLLAGCSDGDAGESTNDTTSSTTPVNTYASEVDGVSAAWPLGWTRIEKTLDARPLSNNVELLVLATFEGAEPGQCAPDPDAAMAQMKENDALFVLRASDGAGDPRPPRPQDLLAVGSQTGSGGCQPEGVEFWRVQFQEHNRPYEAFVAARSPLSATRRSEIQTIWANLRLTPIDDGRAGAVIGRAYWHSLYTHCGIRATEFDGREWVADPELSDGQSNPPRDWGNPYEAGSLVLESEASAVFTSRDGERSARFRPRLESDPPLGMCE